MKKLILIGILILACGLTFPPDTTIDYSKYMVTNKPDSTVIEVKKELKPISADSLKRLRRDSIYKKLEKTQFDIKSQQNELKLLLKKK